MQLYHDTSFKISQIITKSYSTSFSLGIKVFSDEYKDGIYGIYGFVRLADEVVDSFHGFDKQTLLSNLRFDTYYAIQNKISTNPVLHSFQQVVNKYNIGKELIDAFLDSMEMDLHYSSYRRDLYDQYIYGSAESVGLMCLHVFCNGDKRMYNHLVEPARKLGSAFQKINFLRDIKSDIEERGRIYLPGIDNLNLINNESKQKLVKEAEAEFDEALNGIIQLPEGVRLGVYLAYSYYLTLLQKVKRSSVEELLEKRIRINNFSKVLILLKCMMKVKFLKERKLKIDYDKNDINVSAGYAVTDNKGGKS